MNCLWRKLITIGCIFTLLMSNPGTVTYANDASTNELLENQDGNAENEVSNTIATEGAAER